MFLNSSIASIFSHRMIKTAQDHKEAVSANTDVFKGIKYVNITVSGLSEKFISLNNDYGLRHACTMKDDREGYQEVRDSVYALSRVLREPPTFTIFTQYFPELAHRFHDSSLRSAIRRFKKDFQLVRFNEYQSTVGLKQKETESRRKILKKKSPSRNKGDSGQKSKRPQKSDADETNIKSIAHNKMRKMLEVNANLTAGEFANKHPDIAAKFDSLRSLGCTLGQIKRSMSSQKKVLSNKIQENAEEKTEARALEDVIIIDSDNDEDLENTFSNNNLNTVTTVSLQNTCTNDIDKELKDKSRKEEKSTEGNLDDSSLPDGWVKLIDECTGRPYYKNCEDDIAQWWPPEKEVDKKVTNLFTTQQTEQVEFFAESSDEELYENLVSWFSSVMNDYSCEYKNLWNDYAGKLYELGFHSVDMIREHCDFHMIDGPEFSWMPLCHKKGLKKWLVENCYEIVALE